MRSLQPSVLFLANPRNPGGLTTIAADLRLSTEEESELLICRFCSRIRCTVLCPRDGRFPLDAFISDYGWFTNVPNAPTQDDFGYNPSTFPDPVAQLASYHADLHVKFGGIRKPRIANASMLAEVTASGFLLDGAANNLNFSIELAREWYAQKQAHYLRAGVSVPTNSRCINTTGWPCSVLSNV